MIDLVPFTKRHLTDRYVAWMNDKAALRYSEQRHRDHTLDTCRAYVESIQPPSILWAVEDGGIHIGNLSATVDQPNLRADLAIYLGTRRGQGLGLIAWKLAIENCRALGLRMVTAGTMLVNRPMLQIMRRSGMEDVSVRHDYFLFEDTTVSLVQMSLLC